MRPELTRAILSTTFHVVLGIAIGLFLAALGRAHQRMSEGGMTRATLFEVLGIVLVALAAWWLAAAVRTRVVRNTLDEGQTRVVRKVFVTPPNAR